MFYDGKYKMILEGKYSTITTMFYPCSFMEHRCLPAVRHAVSSNVTTEHTICFSKRMLYNNHDVLRMFLHETSHSDSECASIFSIIPWKRLPDIRPNGMPDLEHGVDTAFLRISVEIGLGSRAENLCITVKMQSEIVKTYPWSRFVHIDPPRLCLSAGCIFTPLPPPIDTQIRVVNVFNDW